MGCATPRDESLCQFVVRDGKPLVEEGAANNPALPQQLVREYGIRAYAGMPLCVRGSAVGTLCVIDTRPRAFTEEQLEALDRARGPPTRARGLVKVATEPALSEIHNLLVPLTMGVQHATTLAFELRRLATPAGGVASAPAGMAAALDELDATLGDLDAVSARMERQSGCLRDALVDDRAGSLPAVFESALILSHHATKNIGGVALRTPLPPRRVTAGAATDVAAALTLVAERARGPIAVEVSAHPHAVAARGLDQDAAQRITATLSELVGAVIVRSRAATVVVELPAEPH